MDTCVVEGMRKSLSDLEIHEIVEGKAEIRFYSELSRMKNLQQCMGVHRACVLLYETKVHFGHWCCFFQVDENTIEFFDSYAIRPDGEFRFVPPDMEEKTDQQPGRLTQLIEQAAATCKIIYNQVPLQEFSDKSDVCGRWVALRIRKRGVPLDKFQELFYKQRLGTPDQLVTLMTIVFDKAD